MDADPPAPETPPGSSAAGKLIALGLPLVIVGATVVLGLIFAGRDRRHRKGRLDGAALYARYCVACHKADGRGDGGSVPSLFPLELEPQAFQAHVAQGKGAMPGFADRLFSDPDPQRDDYTQLRRYLEELQAR
ncbi:MAG: cytochrome c [Planctomycetota bacterium]